MLTDDEKLTLGMVLREKIVETHDVDEIIQQQLLEITTHKKRLVLKEALKNIREVRDHCYSIAVKLKIK